MAEPKKRLTSTRSGNRRSQIRLREINLTVCPKCKQRVRPHYVCGNCGYYKDETVIPQNEK